MQIAIATVSILLITLLVWGINKLWKYEICPICVGVSLTWLGFLTAGFLGYVIDWLIPAIMIGGSVVGGSYLLEKQVGPGRPFLLGKTLFIAVGFIVVYELMAQNWSIVILGVLFLLAVVVYYLKFSKQRLSPEARQKIKELEKQMKDCC